MDIQKFSVNLSYQLITTTKNTRKMNATETKITELRNYLKSLNYDNNGNPIGVDPCKYVLICDELETLENE